MIEDGKIVSVGVDAGAADAGATVIDLSSKTVFPGRSMRIRTLRSIPGSAMRSWRIRAPTCSDWREQCTITLEAGFTTVRNVGDIEFADVALRDAINAGDVPGPRMVVSGPALSITGGHCDDNLLPYEYHATDAGVADGVENVQHKVREIIKYGADVIKICATGGVLSMGDDPQHSQFTLAELAAIVADAHRLGRKVAAHAHGAEGIRWSAEAGVDSIEHGPTSTTRPLPP